MNGVSSMARGNPPKNADITVNTETDNNPSAITVMFVKNVQATSITVGWQPPSDGDEIEIEMYEVRYSVKGSKTGKNTRNDASNTNNPKTVLLVLRGSKYSEHGLAGDNSLMTNLLTYLIVNI